MVIMLVLNVADFRGVATGPAAGFRRDPQISGIDEAHVLGLSFSHSV